MLTIRLAAIGFMVVTAIFSVQANGWQSVNPASRPRPLPTPQAAQDLSPGLQLLKQISNQVVKDYKENTIMNLLNILQTQVILEEKKPDGYGALPFYTPQNKKDIIETITKDLDKTTKSVQQMISELEKEEKSKGPIPVDRLYKLFANNVLGQFNLIWKNLNTHMVNMKEQVIRTKTLKEHSCPSTLNKIQAGAQKAGTGVKRFLGGIGKSSSSEKNETSH